MVEGDKGALGNLFYKGPNPTHEGFPSKSPHILIPSPWVLGFKYGFGGHIQTIVRSKRNSYLVLTLWCLGLFYEPAVYHLALYYAHHHSVREALLLPAFYREEAEAQ